MRSKRSSAARKKANRVTKPNKSDEKRTKNKDSMDKENLTGSYARRKKNDFEVIVPESEGEESFQESSKRISQRLNISVAETESEDGVESVDMFDEDEEEVSSPESTCQASRKSPRKLHGFYVTSFEESDTDYYDAFESFNDDKEDTGNEDSPRSSRSTDDVGKTQVYCLKTVTVPLEDIGGLVQPNSNGTLTKYCTFSIKTSKRPSSSFSSQSTISSKSDPSDDEFSLSESSITDSEDSSSSGSNFSWESECESISSSNSWLPKRYISSSEEDSDSKSEELEEIEDDFVLHTKRKRKELRKKNYLLRKRNSAIRSKVAKYCDESSEESTSSESSEE